MIHLIHCFSGCLRVLCFLSNDSMARVYGLVLLLNEGKRLNVSSCPRGIDRAAHPLKELFRLIDPLLRIRVRNIEMLPDIVLLLSFCMRLLMLGGERSVSWGVLDFLDPHDVAPLGVDILRMLPAWCVNDPWFHFLDNLSFEELELLCWSGAYSWEVSWVGHLGTFLWR